MNLSRQNHLSTQSQRDLGSFYTPQRYVLLVQDWLQKYQIANGSVIIDPSCGYGAFFELQNTLSDNVYIGNDIDLDAVRQVKKYFPKVQLFNFNTLKNAGREKFKIAAEDRLIVVGNPPYNDVTSQINARSKRHRFEADTDLRTRDLGLSSLLAYNKMRADYVAVLHPLSYLIKRANFNAAGRFFRNYQLLENLVFSSQEFAGVSGLSSFPIVVGFYRRAVGQGLSFEQVQRTVFRTTEGVSFSVDMFDYVTDFVAKYPSGRRYRPEILFYTLRDINALRRSRTFIKERVNNAVDVDPQKLPFYCYIDCFKDRLAEVPYYFGNFNIPFIKNEFAAVARDFVAVSARKHPDIFKQNADDLTTAQGRVNKYIDRVLTKGVRND